jgi:hypothetical protein
MWDLLTEHPWLIPCFLGALIPLSAIIFGTMTSQWRRVRIAELEASLKHEMIQRGMSADEICQVLQASSKGSRKGSQWCEQIEARKS